MMQVQRMQCSDPERGPTSIFLPVEKTKDLVNTAVYKVFPEDGAGMQSKSEPVPFDAA
jgi:hypothetical protein